MPLTVFTGTTIENPVKPPKTVALLHQSAAGQIQRRIDDHVLLPTDHFSPTQFDQDVDGTQPVALGSRFGMAKEA